MKYCSSEGCDEGCEGCDGGSGWCDGGSEGCGGGSEGCGAGREGCQVMKDRPTYRQKLLRTNFPRNINFASETVRRTKTPQQAYREKG